MGRRRKRRSRRRRKVGRIYLAPAFVIIIMIPTYGICDAIQSLTLFKEYKLYVATTCYALAGLVSSLLVPGVVSVLIDGGDAETWGPADVVSVF